MKKTIQLLLLLFIVHPVSSQSFNVGFELGRGTYSMEELKNFNQMVFIGLDFPAKRVSKFPSYYYYNPIVKFEFNNLSIGSFFTFQSTGSIISSKDYSGEYRFEMLAKVKSFGIHYLQKLNPGDSLEFGIYSNIGYNITGLSIKEKFELFEENIADNDYSFEANSYFIEPGIRLSYHLTPFKIQLTTGYNFEFSKKSLKPSGLYSDYLPYYITEEMKMKTDWSGFRFGLSLFYCFSIS